MLLAFIGFYAFFVRSSTFVPSGPYDLQDEKLGPPNSAHEAPDGGQTQKGVEAPSPFEKRVDTPPIGQAQEGAEEPAVPVLMYHVIGDNDGPLKGLYVSRDDFSAQIAMLKEKGYETISTRRLYDYLTGADLSTRLPIVITFDDGYESVYKDAYPILKEAGYKAVIFLQTGMLGKQGGLSVEAVQEMLEGGVFELGAHGEKHLDLTKCDQRQLESEVKGSKEALEEAFEVPVSCMAYPAGRHDAKSIDTVKSSGYLMAFGTEYGFIERGAELFSLPRIRVDRADGVDGLRKKLEASRKY